MKFPSFPLGLALVALLLSPITSPALNLNLDKVKDIGGKVLGTDSTTASSSGSVSESEVISGLKEALGIAIDRSIDYLGQPGGYLDTPEVTIPLPDELELAGKALRAVGQDELVDEFIATMNNAAEEAVPETVDIFTQAIKDMSIADAQGILEGEDDAATQYFERTTTDDLTELIRPIVAVAMQQTGVTSAYSSLTGQVAAVAPLVGVEVQDLEGYVTQKALDGLFYMMAKEESAIRSDPVQWTTDILKKVFGSVY